MASELFKRLYQLLQKLGMKFSSKKLSGKWWAKPKETLAFVLWKRTNNCNTIELIIYDVETFKKQYAAHKHLTKDESKYYWTRENFLNS